MSKFSNRLSDYVHVKLALLGLEATERDGGAGLDGAFSSFVAQYREKERLLANHLCPADHRIQTFLYDYLQELPVPKVPARTFVLDCPGMARLISLPEERDEFYSPYVNSYRVKQGILHNPRNDRRTTQGSFHICEGGLPVPADKKTVPKGAFATLLAQAWQPPAELMRLPFTAERPQPAECFVSLFMRPLVCPAVPGFCGEKAMEIRFFAPGSLVSNLDFVETIFGNAGDPGLPQNDAGLDTETWSGHTGCVVLAPHLMGLTKKAIGLPAWETATEHQRRDGMCWREENELYNEGQSFKLSCRDQTGVMVTIIADNYYGYCKKEVKTQISFAANLFGICEEEHAGGALVFPSYDLGEDFSGELHVKSLGHSYPEVVALYGESIVEKPEGYAIDKRFPEVIYVPQDAHFDLHKQRVSWFIGGAEFSIKLVPENTYVRPSGYRVRMEKPHENRSWRLVGTTAEGTLCHKPCTVSGGGKSEISKPITDAILTGPVFVANFKNDFDQVEQLIARDYTARFKDKSRVDSRPIFSAERSLGSVIKLLTPDERDYTAEYNQWLSTVPHHIKELVYVVKRYYKEEWGNLWRDHFSVDTINGIPANELKCHNRKLLTTYLRVGFEADGSWRTFGLRKDFHAALKIQLEDDITASVVVPAAKLSHQQANGNSLKFVKNAEARLFQRPDDAVYPGYDKQTEADFVRPDNFFSNYEPLTPQQAKAMVEDAIEFHQYTNPMQSLILEATKNGAFQFFVCSARPRIVNGKPSKNPRYLQARADLINEREPYLAEMSSRLRRRLRPADPVLNPVNAVLPGRRNNPAEPGIRSLAVFNPIHYFELPELFMEFICSMTGKSPSTTGAGSEGALTKGPFNALPPIMDLNTALVSWLLTGHDGFVTAAGYIGPKFRVDHDISLLVPEVWCRMSPEERNPTFLIRGHFLEKCEDFEHEKHRILAGRLGYRITMRFVHAFFGRIFNHPHAIFNQNMLRPELQDLGSFADGVENIVSTQRRVAQMYFDDGSVQQACPPLQALLHVMLSDQWEGKGLEHPELRALFTRESLLASDWYAARLKAKQEIDCRLWSRHVEYLQRFLKKTSHADEARRLGIRERLASATTSLKSVEASKYLEDLRGTLGAEPIKAYLI